MGLLINIEAIDRGGKTTQARLVAEALEALGLKVGTMSFPDTPSRSKESTPAHFSTGILIERDLDRNLPLMDGRDSLFRIGELAELSDEAKELIIVNVGEKLVQMLYSINRRERRDALEAALAAHDVVLVGRYLSAYTYGVACGVSRIQLASMEGDLRQPDHTFLLDLDPSVAKERRADEGYDRYEADTEFQAKVRRLYGELVREDLEAAEADSRPARFTRVDASREPGPITADIVEGIRSLVGR
jgi:thymidylate kinase